MKKFNISKGLVIGLLTLALCLTCFAAVKVSAADAPSEVSATYNATDNTVVAAAKTVIYVVKAQSGNVIKPGATCYTMSKATISLSDLGIKSTTKDVYLYACDKEFSEEATVNANLIIKAQAAKKITGVIDYTKVDNAQATDVLSATCLDSNKKAIENPTIIWSADGTKYETSDAFTGAKLLKMLEDGGGVIYIKQVGTSGGSGDAVLTSKEVKVKVAKQPKAVTVKMDVKKSSLALKNGFDFGLATVNGKKVTAPSIWHTILPLNKSAQTEGILNSIVPTTSYKPLSKKESDALKKAADREDQKVSYTKTPIKTLSLNTLASVLYTEVTGKTGAEDLLFDGFTLAYRKSATEKKPASAITYAVIAPMTEAPLVFTAEKVDGQYVISTGESFDKGLVSASIVNFPGTTGNPKTIATTGFWNSFKVVKASNKDADGNPSSYEYAVVKFENLYPETDSVETDSIDWSTVAWKAFVPEKTKITGKFSTKYSTTGAKSVTATLKAGSPEVSTGQNAVDIINGIAEGALTTGREDFKTVFESVLLIRRSGVKGKTIDDSVMASDYIVLFVAKVDKTYYLVSTADVGAAANKYTVKFSKWMEGDPDVEGSTTGGYYIDSASVEMYGWQLKNTDVSVTLPGLSGAEYEKASKASGAGSSNVLAGKIAYDNSGEPAISDKNVLTFKTANAVENSVIVVPIKVWANVEIVAAITGDKDATQALYTIKDGKEVLVLDNDGKPAKATPTAATKFVGDTVSLTKYFAAPTITNFNIYLDTAGCDSSDFKDNITQESGTNPKAKFENYKVKSTEIVKVEIPYTSVALYDLTLNLTPANLQDVVADSGNKVIVYKDSIADANNIELTTAAGKKIENGTKLIVLVKPATGYNAKVEFGGEELELIETDTAGVFKTKELIEMDAKNTLKVSAVAKTFNLTEPTGSGYTYTLKSGAKDGVITYGTSLVFDVKPDAGKQVSVKYKVGSGDAVDTDLNVQNNLTYTLPYSKFTDDITIVVTASDAEYSLSWAGSNATHTVTSGVTNDKVKHGTSLVFTVEPADNYRIQSVTATAGGRSVSLTESSGTYTLDGDAITGAVVITIQAVANSN